MKVKSVKELKGKIKDIEKAYHEAKGRYSHENKEKIKKESKDLLKLFLSEEEETKNEFQKRINEKIEEIKKYEETNGRDLFNLFSNEEKINNISVKLTKLKKIGSTNFSSNNEE